MNCPKCNKLMVDVTSPAYCPSCETAAIVAVGPCSTPPWPLEGRKYIMKINGARSLNGALYGATMFGEVGPCDPDRNAWDLLRALIDKAEAENPTMEHVQFVNLEMRVPNNI